jgi:selenocysteine-specific elongation factor
VGDRFILRDASAGRTLGGGVVIDPFPLSRRAGRVKRRERLEAMSALDPEVALRGLLAAFDEGVDMVEFGRAFNLTPAAREALEMRVGAQRIGPRALSADGMAALESRLVSAVHQFHEHSPQAKGMEIAELRRMTAPSMSEATFGTALRLLAARLNVEILGSLARRAGHVSTANRQDEVLWQRAKPRLMEAGFRGIAVSELASVLRVPESTLTDFLHRKTQDGGLVRVTAKRFYPREVVAQLAAIADSLAAQSSAGSFIAAQFRDASGINRGLAIEILECLDRIGVTQRVGDSRKMGSNYAAKIGPGPDGATAELKSTRTPHALRTRPRADLPAAASNRSRR